MAVKELYYKGCVLGIIISDRDCLVKQPFRNIFIFNKFAQRNVGEVDTVDHVISFFIVLAIYFFVPQLTIFLLYLREYSEFNRILYLLVLVVKERSLLLFHEYLHVLIVVF